jgi:hypothetical protein
MIAVAPPTGGDTTQRTIAGTVTEYPDRVGNVILTGQGSGGSRFQVIWTFMGFHVWCNPVLNMYLESGKTPRGDLVSNMYVLYPKATRATVSARLLGGYTSGTMSWTNTINRSYFSQLPELEEFKQLLEARDLPHVPFHIAFNDQRPIDGECKLTLQGFLGAGGLPNNAVNRTVPYCFGTEGDGVSHVVDHYRGESWGGRAFFNCAFSLNFEDHTACYGDSSPCHKDNPTKIPGMGGMWVKFEGAPEVVDHDVDLEDLYCSGTVSQTGEGGGETWTIRATYRFGLKKEIDATLEPEDDEEYIWLPSPGDTRQYKLTLNEPSAAEVEAVRFTLHDTSQHPGVATNAGNHIRGDSCSDCSEGKQSEPRAWETFFSTGADGEPLEIYRIYTQYNDCPVDRQPDLFFTEEENPDYRLVEETKSTELAYDISQSIERDDEITDETLTAVVTVMDSAASAELGAEIKWGGIWYEVKATGRTATDAGDRLMIPLDKDGDQLPDTWENGSGVDSPTADNDAKPAGMFTGDGLTNFEEYRGVYSEGVLTRLWPNQKDVFVYDDSTRYDSQLRQVQSDYADQGLQLWILEEDEFRDDLINWYETEHRGGDQYIIVAMAAHSWPPTRCPRWT